MFLFLHNIRITYICSIIILKSSFCQYQNSISPIAPLILSTLSSTLSCLRSITPYPHLKDSIWVPCQMSKQECMLNVCFMWFILRLSFTTPYHYHQMLPNAQKVLNISKCYYHPVSINLICSKSLPFILNYLLFNNEFRI